MENEGKRQEFRSKITGFLFGKYVLEEEIGNYLIPGEDYISGIEIIYYNELFYFISGLILISSIILTILFSPIALVLILFAFGIIYYATQLELVYLTNERIIIENRTWFEKLFKTSNIQSIAIDQIAVISYSRAPFNYLAIFFGLGMLLLPFLGMFFLEIGSQLFFIIVFFIILVGLVGTYFIFWGFRLNKRSIEIFVIGVPRSIGIGRKKGAVLWFLDEIQKIAFERIHHVFHTDNSPELDVAEFPLNYSGVVKEMIENIENQMHKDILILLDGGNLTKNEILKHLGRKSKEEVDLAMRLLRRSSLIFYSRKMKVWCLNKHFIWNQEMRKQRTN